MRGQQEAQLRAATFAARAAQKKGERVIEGFEIGHHTADSDGWLTGTTVVAGPRRRDRRSGRTRRGPGYSRDRPLAANDARRAGACGRAHRWERVRAGGSGRRHGRSRGGRDRVSCRSRASSGRSDRACGGALRPWQRRGLQQSADGRLRSAGSGGSDQRPTCDRLCWRGHGGSLRRAQSWLRLRGIPARLRRLGRSVLLW